MAIELVFVPAPLVGHLISAVEIAKLLVDHHHLISVTIFIMDFPFDSNVTAYIHAAASSLAKHHRIRLTHLHTYDLHPHPGGLLSILRTLNEKSKQPMRDSVSKLIAESDKRVAGFIVDMFCLPMIEVAHELGLPSYLYYTSGASILGLSFHLQDHHDAGTLDQYLHGADTVMVPTFANPVPLLKVLPSSFMDEQEFPHFIERIKCFRSTKGILVNTFVELEPYAVDSLLESGAGIPPIYPVGPVLNLEGYRKNEEEETIVEWLDSQPTSSVLFLCFGSLGCLDADQVTEMAFGIEKSRHRFLWSLRRPPENGEMNPGEYSNPEEVLPEGFLKRTTEIGKVIGWAPQVEILSHSAVGGFVSHCGWNSVLESIWFGVPMATWPLYAEQQVNGLMMARELGLAAEITVEYKKDLKSRKANMLVGREEIERGVRCVMEKESELRKKVKAMKETSRKAVVKGGSSYTWLGRFIQDVISSIPP